MARPLELTVLYLAVWANFFWPVLRFDFQIANYAAFAAAQLTPVAILVAASVRTGWRRWIWIIVGVLLLVPAGPFGLGAAACSVLSIRDGPPLERRQVVSNEYGTVVVYRSDPGANDWPGIIVRQECPIVPGLAVVRSIGTAYPADEARIEMQPFGTVGLVFENNERRPAVLTTYQVRLRRFCWGPSL